MGWYNKFTQLKAFKEKISKELMPVAWHSTRWWDRCLPGDKKKGIEPVFTDKVEKSCKLAELLIKLKRVDS